MHQSLGDICPDLKAVALGVPWETALNDSVGVEAFGAPVADERNDGYDDSGSRERGTQGLFDQLERYLSR